MTYYHNSQPTTYEITAFSEASLGSNIACNTTFTMPAADTCITVKDNDRYLSGDQCRDEQAADSSYQTASILTDGVESGNGGQIYAEQYFWVKDTAGNWYVLIEIEQEGTNDDYFTFYTGGDYDVPPEGAELTVYSKCNVTSEWLKYNDLGAGECAPPTGSISGTVFCDTDCDGINGEITVVPGPDYTIEAEDMWDCGFQTVYSSTASGGKAVKLKCFGGYGELAASFDGESGKYDIKIHVQDENDGQSTIKVLVGGQFVDAIKLDADTDGGGDNDGAFSTYVIKDVQVDHGETVKLKVYGDDGELVRIDKIDFEGEDKEVVVSEPTKAGVLIKLVDLAGNVVAETTTDADGNYAFNSVPVGDYKIMGVAPDGTEFTIQDANGNADDDIDSDVDANGMSGVISVTAGGTYDVDLGVCDKPEPETGTITGTVFCDTDCDGLSVESGPSGDFFPTWAQDISNIVVYYDKDGDGVIDFSVKVDEFPDGATASFISNDLDDFFGQLNDFVVSSVPGLSAATVVVGVSIKGGIQPTQFYRVDGDTSGPAPDSGPTLNTGPGNDVVLDYADFHPFYDPALGGGGSVTEPVKAGVVIKLLDAGGNVIAETTTDDDGNYSFTDVPVGDYKIMGVAPDGTEFTIQDVNGNADDDIDSDVDANGMSGVISVTAGGEYDVDLGVCDKPEQGALSGRYFCDTDNDDVDDGQAIDPGIAGVVVELLDAAGNATGITTTTGPEGEYSFTGLAAGTYGVRFTDPNGALDGKQLVDANVGTDDTIDSDAIGDAALSEITGIVVVAGGETKDNDAGAEYLGALGDMVWFDTDGDGIQDADELGVENVTVTLTGAGDDGVLGTSDDTTAVKITDADGKYLFENLEAGDYKVTFSNVPAGYVFTTQNAGTDDAIDSDAGASGMTDTVSLAAGEINLTVDAGIVDPGTASLAGRYFCDENDNDIDDGEPGVGGVTVTLRKADGTLVAVATTLGDGSYEFTGLMAGDYVVTFDADPTGKTFVAPNVGTDDTVDSDGVLNSDGTASTGIISLAIGEQSEDHDVGVEYVNTPPVATPDTGKGCADEVFSVDLLANDTDADAGDALSVLSISDADETVGVGGTITLADGALVTLNTDGTVSVDGVAAYADLLIGEQATDDFTYTLSDGAGGSAAAPVDLTFCGAKNTLETIDASLAGATVTYQVQDVTTVAAFAAAYTLDLLSSSSADISIGAYTAAYCINALENFDFEVDTTAEVSVATVANATAAGVVNAGNIDLVNWILNQDFTAINNGDGIGDTYTDLEVQEAIWTLLNGDTFFINNPAFPGFVEDDEDGVREPGEIATLENVAEIVNFALNDANFDGVVDGGADGYTPGQGDIVGLILDPTSPDSQEQPFIIGVAFDDLSQDCFCF